MNDGNLYDHNRVAIILLIVLQVDMDFDKTITNKRNGSMDCQIPD